VPARVVERAAGADALRLELAEPARAITPGQSGVLYHGDRLLGGGIIQ
jgi:tRNA U34 2-thiouridine synthase MnmA/TrmU